MNRHSKSKEPLILISKNINYVTRYNLVITYVNYNKNKRHNSLTRDNHPDLYSDGLFHYALTLVIAVGSYKTFEFKFKA